MPDDGVAGSASSANVAPDVVSEVERLYARGLYLEAWKAAERAAPLHAWKGVGPRIIAGRLAYQLGDRRLGRRLHLRLHRVAPGDALAWEWSCRALEHRLSAWDLLRLLSLGPALERAEALSWVAVLAANLRDFDEAERMLTRAEARGPESAWVAVDRAAVCQMADAYEAAMEAADRALTFQPWYRPAVEARAHLLLLADRGDEAEAFLAEASSRIESGSVAMLLAARHIEEERAEDAEAALDRAEEVMPLRGREVVAWLAERRSDVEYLRGDRAGAERWARQGGPFHRALADRLARAAPDARRVVIDVPFVRQHHMTCAPAVLAALSRHHGVSAGHLQIVDAICYDGTTSHAERGWAERTGYCTREFTVGWDSARALLDRGLPFTLVTHHPGGAHLQSVVGYDEARGTLYLRDPFHALLGEITPAGLDEQRVAGPRGMALAPPALADRLDGLDLPESDLYDLYHRVQSGLWQHDRPDAAAACDALEARAPGHRLALQARRSMADYDGDLEAELAAVQGLHALFPDDVNLRLGLNHLMARLGRHARRIEWLRSEQERRPHPLLARALADALLDDARAWPEAERLARHVIRTLPFSGDGYRVLASIIWRTERERAVRAARVAACLEPTREDIVRAYFELAWLSGRAEEGLAFLASRRDRLGRRSALPAFTLFDALATLARHAEAHEVLERALEQRPGDGQLLLFAARAEAARGRLETAEALLDRARGAAAASDLARTAARIAEGRGDLPRALTLWREVTVQEPLDTVAVRAVADLLVTLEGRPAAIADLRARVERFPHHQEMGQLLAEQLREAGGEGLERELQRMLEANPTHAWSARELALHMARSGRPDEALRWARRGRELQPGASGGWNVEAVALEALGRMDEAKAALRSALTVYAEDGWAIGELMRLSVNVAERREHLRWLRGELGRQVAQGDGLLHLQAHAFGALEPDELLGALRDSHRARPDLWHAWVALGRQLAQTGAEEEARTLLEEAAARFPLHPRVWRELARALPPGPPRREALEKSFALAPWDVATLTTLADVLHREGDFEAELAVLERGLRHAPRNALLHGFHADALIATGKEEEAAAALRSAVVLDPSYGWAFSVYRQLCASAGRPGEPLRLAEEIAASRPGDARAHVLLSRVRPSLEGQLAAVRVAIRLEPLLVEAHARHVQLLADAGRRAEALAAASPPWNGPLPPTLRLTAVRLRREGDDHGTALSDLRALLSEEPDLADGWAELAEIHLAAGRAGEAAEAARQMVRLRPGEALPHAYLGAAALASGDRTAGKESVARALALDPAHHWARRRLMECHLEDGEIEAAEALLASADPIFSRTTGLALRVRVAARRSREAALEALRACAATDVGEDALAKVAEELDGLGWKAEVDGLLRSLLGAPEAHRAAGRLLALRLGWDHASRRTFGKALLAALRESSPPGEAVLGAATAFIERLAESQKVDEVRAMVRRSGEVARSDVMLWGTVGYALSTAGRPREAVTWLSGWREREGVRPWMLVNLALALRDLGRDAEAAEASRAAAVLEGDRTSRLHPRWLAFDAARAGDFAPLDAMGTPESDLPPIYSAIFHLAQALRAGTARPGREGWAAAVPHLRAAGNVARGIRRPCLARYRRQVVWRLARRGGALAPFLYVGGMQTVEP